jgi:hypothetical protein
MVDKVEVELTADERKAVRAIGKVIKKVDKLGDEAVKSSKKMDGSLSIFAGNLAAIAGSAVFNRIVGGLGAIVDASKELGVIRTQFEVITGSTAAAQRQLEDLQAFAASTPFQLPGLATATRQLLSFGVEQSKIIPTLRQIGDIAAGTGSAIDDLTIPYGRLISTQKLTLIELDKFADRGVNLYKKLSDQTGISLKIIRDEISKGRVPFEEFTTALNSLTDEGGTFFGGMEKRSKTLSGVISTLDDDLFNLKAQLGDLFSPALISGAGIFSDAIKAVSQDIKVLNSIATGESIEKLDDKLARVTENLKRNQSAIDNINSGTEEGFLARIILGGKEDRLAQLEKTRGELERVRLEMKAQDEEQAKGGAAAGNVAEDPRVIQEKLVQEEIGRLKEEKKLVEEEGKIRQKDLDMEATEEDFQRLHEIEQRKVELRFAAEEDKANLIRDAREKQLKLEQIGAKKEVEIEKQKNKAILEDKKRRTENEKQLQALSLAATSNFIQTGINLTKQGSAANRLLQSGAALVNTYGAATKALNQPPGPPATLPLVASTVALGLSQVAKINNVSFANGGVIGGFQGATFGPDDRLAEVRTGEMMLNAPQQKELFDTIAGGGSTSKIDKLAEQIGELSSRPVIVQIDGREIARSVRDQRQQGFAI